MSDTVGGYILWCSFWDTSPGLSSTSSAAFGSGFCLASTRASAISSDVVGSSAI